MVRKIVIFAFFITVSAVLGLLTLSLLSLNFVYVRSECPSLEREITYRAKHEPIVSVWSRRLYVFRSVGDGTLTFNRTTGDTYSLGYLTSGVPTYFLVHFDKRCRSYGRQHLLP